MTRSEKILKLANAVKDLRGSYHEHSKKWIRPPRLGDMDRVRLCISRLNLPVEETLHEIRMFTTYQQFNDWIKSL